MRIAGILTLILALVLTAGAAVAQQGEFRVVNGTVVHPDTVGPDTPFVVIRGADRTYYADLSAARPTTALSTGQAVTVVGYQGREPDHIVALGIEPAAAGGAPGVPGATATSLNLPPDHHYDVFDPNTGQPIVRGDTGQIPELIAQGHHVYDATAGRWVNHPSVGGINPEYRGAPVAGTPPAAPVAEGEWARVRGTVQSVDGSALQFRAEDGRTLNVDMSRVNPEVQQALRPREGATIVGFPREGNRFEGRYIQRDVSDPTRGGTIVGQPAAPPAGPVDEQAWQRVRGVVQSIQGNTLRLRAQDGRTITADVQEVNPEVRTALNPGDDVTVVGFYRGNHQTMSARYVQQEGGAAASPRTR